MGESVELKWLDVSEVRWLLQQEKKLTVEEVRVIEESIQFDPLKQTLTRDLLTKIFSDDVNLKAEYEQEFEKILKNIQDKQYTKNANFIDWNRSKQENFKNQFDSLLSSYYDFANRVIEKYIHKESNFLNSVDSGEVNNSIWKILDD